MSRYSVHWDELSALEVTPQEVAKHAEALSAAYNDPANAPLMGHTKPLSPADVIDSYREGIKKGMRAFLLYQNGELVGDADLRGVKAGRAEFAFMIAMPSAQGKGLGTRFALMLHDFGFRELELRRIYASVSPQNVASLRVFEKLGYVVDTSPAARAYADEPTDVTLSLERETFERDQATALSQIRIGERD
ncbi:MAG TPA: GNAT family protein [Kofleriaceae bacterium]